MSDHQERIAKAISLCVITEKNWDNPSITEEWTDWDKLAAKIERALRAAAIGAVSPEMIPMLSSRKGLDAGLDVFFQYVEAGIEELERP